MRRLLRASPLVDAWFDLLPPGQQPLARALHELILETAPQLVPVVKWGTLGYQLEDATVLSQAPHKVNMQLQVANGAALALRFPELEGMARAQRYLRMRYSQPFDRELVTDLVLSVISLGVQRQRHG